jgi:hypothetical protein
MIAAMGNGVTVIFGIIRAKSAKLGMSGCSGPPPGSWAKPCAAVVAPRRERGCAEERKPIHDESNAGRDFNRRIRTFVGE